MIGRDSFQTEKNTAKRGRDDESREQMCFRGSTNKSNIESGQQPSAEDNSQHLRNIRQCRGHSHSMIGISTGELSPANFDDLPVSRNAGLHGAETRRNQLSRDTDDALLGQNFLNSEQLIPRSLHHCSSAPPSLSSQSVTPWAASQYLLEINNVPMSSLPAARGELEFNQRSAGIFRDRLASSSSLARPDIPSLSLLHNSLLSTRQAQLEFGELRRPYQSTPYQFYDSNSIDNMMANNNAIHHRLQQLAYLDNTRIAFTNSMASGPNLNGSVSLVAENNKLMHAWKASLEASTQRGLAGFTGQCSPNETAQSFFVPSDVKLTDSKVSPVARQTLSPSIEAASPKQPYIAVGIQPFEGVTDQTKKLSKKSKERSSRSKRKSNEGRMFGYDPGRLVPLHLESDDSNLSEFQCLLRKQIYICEAGEHDVNCGAQGRNKPISLGQVGIVCRYCSSMPPGLRPSGSVYYPSKLDGLYQASQNMANNHFFKRCLALPENVRTRLLELKEKRPTAPGGGKQFWTHGAHFLKIVECENGELRFAKGKHVGKDRD